MSLEKLAKKTAAVFAKSFSMNKNLNDKVLVEDNLLFRYIKENDNWLIVIYIEVPEINVFNNVFKMEIRFKLKNGFIDDLKYVFNPRKVSQTNIEVDKIAIDYLQKIFNTDKLMISLI